MPFIVLSFLCRCFDVILRRALQRVDDLAGQALWTARDAALLCSGRSLGPHR